jgi:uncharacterized protein DUF6533
MSLMQADIDAYLQLLTDAQRTRTVALCAFVCLVWHHITTFDQEARFIWLPLCRINGTLFVCMRYLTLASFMCVFYIHPYYSY